MPTKKKVLLSGMRPTGELHIGNYFGALQPLVSYQKDYHIYLMVADLHALTTLENTAELRERRLYTSALYIAFGINPKKTTLFVQSEIPEHAELATLLGMVTPMSLVELNPVYKEMLQEHPSKRTFGLLGYPVLQAADILLYKSYGVPVGKDQAPHIELAREIVRKFNSVFGHTFIEPETLLAEGAKIPSLHDPMKKMSKSHGENKYIGLLDDFETIKKKIGSAVTDSENTITYNPEHRPGISNLIMLYKILTGEPEKNIEIKYVGKGYREFKEDLAGLLSKHLESGQRTYRDLIKSKRTLEHILYSGTKKARVVAQKTRKEAYRRAGL